MRGIRFHLNTNSGISEVVSRKSRHIYIYVYIYICKVLYLISKSQVYIYINIPLSTSLIYIIVDAPFSCFTSENGVRLADRSDSRG